MICRLCITCSLCVSLLFSGINALALTGEYKKCPTPHSGCNRVWNPNWDPETGGVPCETGGHTCEYHEYNTIVSAVSIAPIQGLGISQFQ